MFNLQDANKVVKQIDALLTNITNLIKKHWKIITVIMVLVVVYYFFTLDPSTGGEQNVGVQQDTTALFESDSAALIPSDTLITN